MNFKKISEYMLVGGLLAVLFIPFIVADSQLFPFITGKAFMFRILVEVLFCFWLSALFFNSEIRPRFSWITGTILAFIALITISDIAGVSFYRSFWSNFERMDGLITQLHLVAYFFVAGSVLNTRRRFEIFLNTSVVAGVIMSFYALLQLAGKLTINQGGVRVDGMFGNATYLAVYMLFSVFIALFLLMRTYNLSSKKNWFLISWYGVAVVFELIVLYHTATRGAILGFIGGLLVTFACIALFEKNKPTLRKLSIGVLAGVLLLIGGFMLIRDTDFVRTSQTLGRFASLSVEEISTQGRRYVWPMAIEGFKENPVLGWGQENFNYVFNKYYDPRMYSQEPWFDRAHNIVLDWLVAGGLLGLLSYFGIFVALLLLIQKNQNLTVTDKSILVGLTAAYFFQNLFVFDNLISYIYFFSLLAYVHSESVRGNAEPLWLSRFATNNFFVKKVVPVVAILIAVGAIYGLNVRPILANRTLIKAIGSTQITAEQSLGYFKQVFEYDTFANGEAVEQLFNQYRNFTTQGVGAETKQAYVALVTEKMDVQAQKYPTDARVLLFTGSMKNRLGDYAGALPYLENARKESPKKQTVFFEIGLSYLSSGEFVKANEYFKAAYDLAPEFTESKILYAIGAIYGKNNVLAKQLLSTVPEESVVSDERIVAAYAATAQIAEAVRLIEKRVVLQPENPEIRFRLAAGYLALGQRVKSVEILRESLTLFPATKDQAEYYIKEIQAGRNP